PDIVKRKQLAEPIHRVVLNENVVCGGKEMVVYKMNWGALEASESQSKSTPSPPGTDKKQEEAAR
ncbi:MAG: hypothetical protein KAW67_06765, partial [Candidatus Eisenbacteria sp.]|nr:hypothetical protein [Candidatus Eisenbacteria bacterium]